MKLVDRLPLYSTRDGYSCGYGGGRDLAAPQSPSVPGVCMGWEHFEFLQFLIFF